jgi:hypothetical protein
MTNNQDIGAALETIKGKIFRRYRGVLLEKLPEGYMCMGRYCATLFDVDRLLEQSGNILSASINRLKQ